jgi:predicted deacylase
MRNGDLMIAGQRFQPGARSEVKVPMVELVDGTPVEVSVMVYSGAKPGPVLYVGSGVHGDEAGCVAITIELMRRLELKALAGTLVVVPVQNPLAFQAQHRLPINFVIKSPLDQAQANMFQLYPGSMQGNTSQIMAYTLYHEVMRQADALVDIHTPTTGGRYIPFGFVPPKRLGAVAEKSWTLARAFGLKAILGSETSTYVSPNTPHVVAAGDGIAAFGVELGEGGRVEDEIVEQGVAGVFNVLKALNMLPGPPAATEEPVVLDKLTQARVRRGGLLRRQVMLGAYIKSGELVGTVTSIKGELVDEVVAPCDGLALRVATFPFVVTGEQVVQIGIPA